MGAPWQINQRNKNCVYFHLHQHGFRLKRVAKAEEEEGSWYRQYPTWSFEGCCYHIKQTSSIYHQSFIIHKRCTDRMEDCKGDCVA